ncbi:fibronectin type III domain-containing protein [Clostridium sp. OS1-26]|uniref:fibronectin type III domain-containing protein n=1 Tax=Clostridium sp. OS1-26 TaxID=3070681 RepID=UPI0027DF271C|nr:fibronectin type III domain-containing protein [Clostridium sp. OS1-26]WML33216.1 fibronectin type III domain-containing protein [Clostridium sp. OS1-26]
MNDGIHTVQIINNVQGTIIDLDAIDIDDAGKLLPYDYTTLTAVANTTNQAITLNWDKVEGATGYNIKKSTTQGSGYTTIASNVIENTCNDRDVEAGKTYYYIVTPIINGQEGTPSNEASATANKPTETGNAILTITMTNGNVKSYTVSMAKVNDFISWYNSRSSGSNGSPCYTFDKTDSLQPFTKKTEYVVFDKISSFEVDEYSK